MNKDFSFIVYDIIGAYSDPKYAHVKFSMKPLGDTICFEVLGDDDETLLVEMKMVFTDDPLARADVKVRVSVTCDGNHYHREEQFPLFVLNDLCMDNAMGSLLDVIVDGFSKFDNEYKADAHEWRANNLVNMVTSGILNLEEVEEVN